MSRLKYITDRIKDTKARLDKEADALALRLDTIDKLAPAIFDHAHAFLEQQMRDVDNIDAELAHLTNLPLDGLPDGLLATDPQFET